MPMNRREKGMLGEEIAKEHLVSLGFKILERGFHCRMGEIDIIAEKNSELYFIEVKTRWSDDFGGPLESVNYSKQRQVIKVAKFYLASKGMNDGGCHLSAIGVDMSGPEPEIDFLPDAFIL